VSEPVKLPKIGGWVKVRTATGDEFGVVVTVNRSRGLILAQMEDGRQVELRLPPGQTFEES
jgi:hypothetical protein